MKKMNLKIEAVINLGIFNGIKIPLTGLKKIPKKKDIIILENLIKKDELTTEQKFAVETYKLYVKYIIWSKLDNDWVVTLVCDIEG